MSFKTKSLRYLSQYVKDGVYVDNIPSKKLSNAIQFFFIEDDEVFFLMDTTVFGSCKTGVAFGLKGIYWNNDWSVSTENKYIPWDVLLEQQEEIKVKAFSVLSISTADNIGLSAAPLKTKEFHEIIKDILKIYHEDGFVEEGNEDFQKIVDKRNVVEPRFIPALDEMFYVPICELNLLDAINIFPESLEKEKGYFIDYLVEVHGIESENNETPFIILLLQWFADSFNKQREQAGLTHSLNLGDPESWTRTYIQAFTRIIIMRFGDFSEEFDRKQKHNWIIGLTAYAVCQLDTIKSIASIMGGIESKTIDEYTTTKILVEQYAFLMREISYLTDDYKTNKVGPRMYYDFLTALHYTHKEMEESERIQKMIGDFVLF